jgi:hypothetical protein
MIRSLPRTSSGLRPAPKAAKGRFFLGLRALVAALIAVLQLTSALHFTLVPHTFSAALGGVVHVHGGSSEARASSSRPRSHGPHAPVIVADALSCAVDRCPFADAPHGLPQLAAAMVSGRAQFGAPGLLTEQEARSANARRVFSSAPKTSPPV